MRDGNRKAFISRADVRAVLPFRPEEYADLAELQALVRLVGPYGVRAIHRETMKFVASNIPAMKDVLALNRKTLSDIGSSYSKDVTIHMKALKEIDTFINRYTRFSTPKEDHRLQPAANNRGSLTLGRSPSVTRCSSDSCCSRLSALLATRRCPTSRTPSATSLIRCVTPSPIP
jgi:hypothetical protein